MPALTELLWGYQGTGGDYHFASGHAATVLVAWSALLFWASREPSERRFVAVVTVFLQLGLGSAGVQAVARYQIQPGQLVLTWVLQTSLLLVLLVGLWRQQSSSEDAD